MTSGFLEIGTTRMVISSIAKLKSRHNLFGDAAHPQNDYIV
jgi:hypothetical protein